MNQTDPQSLSATEIDRRAEVRRRAFGTVRLLIEERGETVLATLLNTSRHGFRVRVESGSVNVGDRVRLHYPWGEVIAKVVWLDSGEAGLFVP